MAEGVVSMDLNYWLDITRYVIDVETGIEILKAATNTE